MSASDKSRQYSKSILFGGVAACALAAAAPSSAQDATSPGLAKPSGNTVTEVIVTAQKQSQRLQDVPIVVTVLSQQKLQDAQVKSVSDLTLLTPGLNVTTNGNESTTIARIRGVGNVSDNPGLEDAVGLYIDGVYRPRNGVGFNDLGELSDIEILKGPQGTLFGKNTIAGVIQITTARPSFNYGFQAEGTVQNYGGYGGSLSVTGPIFADVLAGRLYLADRERDGFVPVVQRGTSNIPSQNDEHVYTARGQLLFTPSPVFDVNVIADYSHRNDHCCVAIDYYNGQGATVGGAFEPGPAAIINSVFPGSIPNPVSPQNFTAYLNRTLTEAVVDEGVSAQANWTTPWFNNAKLTSITAFRRNSDKYGGDTDDTLADIVNSTPSNNYTRFKQFSEELQYAGHSARLDWQVGGFFSHEVLDSGTQTQFGTQLGAYVAALSTLPAAGFAAGEGDIDKYHQVEQGEAIYTQDTFHVTDKLLLTGGLRYTWEHKDLNTSFTNNDTTNLCANVLQLVTGSPTPLPFSAYVNFPKSALGTPCLINPAFAALGSTRQTLNEHALTGTAKVQYKFTPDAMAYASYSRGNLVGGFNLAEVTKPFGAGGAPNTSLAPQTDTSFPDEKVDAYEIGAKTTILDRRVSLNGALFYQKYYDHQLNAFTGTQFVEFTIPSAIAEGVELETQIAVATGVRLNAGVTYADTYYPNNAENKAALQAPGSNLYLLPGKRLTYAPLWSAVVGADYEHALFDKLVGTASVDMKYSSSYNVGSDEDPIKNQPGFFLVGASVGIATADKRVALQIWSTNIFNQFYKQTAFDGVIQTNSSPPAANPGLNSYYYFPGQPRFFGATIRFKY
jgi:outer membrane receptor protein involved in Fe transport